MPQSIVTYSLIFQCIYQMCSLLSSHAGESDCVDDAFRCSNGKFLKSASVCDGHDHCGDNSDERPEMCRGPLDVRLVGGTNDSSGRLEIKSLGKWGSVWVSDFTEQDAKVICHMLGFDGPSYIFEDDSPGTLVERMWLEKLRCTGSEISIDDCMKPSLAFLNCKIFKAVSVVCSHGPLLCGMGNHHTVGEKYITSDTFTEIDEDEISSNEKLARTTGKISAISNVRNRRIVSGKMATSLTNFPWIAEISFDTDFYWFKNTSVQYHVCGAAIISKHFVLTVAHCLDWLTDLFDPPEKWKSILRVTVGEYYQLEEEKFEETFQVDDVILHNDYFIQGLIYNDIAILKLKTKNGRGIHFNNRVQPVCLPSVNTPLVDNRLAVIGGWGISNTQHEVNNLTNYLHIGEVPILSHSLCDKYAKQRRHLHAGHLCAGYYEGGTDACDGDSGGPLVQSINGRFTLLGLTSQGPDKCGKANSPSVYTNIKYYLPWIFQTMKKMQAQN